MMRHSETIDDNSEIRRLIVACRENDREAALALHLQPTHWAQIFPYLHPATLAPSQILISQGAMDRTVYFIESGSLSVHFEDAAGRIRLAAVGPGSAVGEGSFFSHKARNATVQAASACRVWALTPVLFTELAQRHTGAALAVTLALGALVADRMLDRRRRVSIT